MPANDPLIKRWFHGSNTLLYHRLVSLMRLPLPALWDLRILQLLQLLPWVFLDLAFLYQFLLSLLESLIGVFLYDLGIVLGVYGLDHVAECFFKTLILLDHCHEGGCWLEKVRRGAIVEIWVVWHFNLMITSTAVFVNLFIVIWQFMGNRYLKHVNMMHPLDLIYWLSWRTNLPNSLKLIHSCKVLHS